MITNKPPTLLPQPRHLTFIGGNYQFMGEKLILVDHPNPQLVLFSATTIKNALFSTLGLRYEISASTAVPVNRISIILRLSDDHANNPQKYLLSITPKGIYIEAHSEQGLFYGCCTLIQIIQNYQALFGDDTANPQKVIPCIEIEDWPDYQNRGVLIDISRNKVPTMETIYKLVELLASWKINQLQLYTEHTFAYQQHPEVWVNSSPFTGDEILKLDQYCRERFVELVPNQNSFGHMERWLRHSQYRELAEAPNGFDFPWEHHSGPFSLNPLNPKSIYLLSSLYDELLPHFSSRQVNVCCDETFDLSQGYSKAACAQLGTGRVYLDFLLKIYNEISKRAHTMQFWGDIIISYPELIHELPKDCISLEWGYEADHPFDSHGNAFASSGIPFYVCPGTSSWNSISGRTENCIKNLSNAAINGKIYGAGGYLNTDWGDNGHWQMLPISYLGFAAGAAYSWSYEANESFDISKALDLYAFQDRAMRLGKIAYDLGNVYREVGLEIINSTVLFEILKQPMSSWRKMFLPAITANKFDQVLKAIDTAASELSEVNSQNPDQALLMREYQLTIDMLRHACMRGKYGLGSTAVPASLLAKDLQKIIAELTDLWLLRNRIGGLLESVALFGIPLADYI